MRLTQVNSIGTSAFIAAAPSWDITRGAISGHGAPRSHQRVTTHPEPVQPFGYASQLLQG